MKKSYPFILLSILLLFSIIIFNKAHSSNGFQKDKDLAITGIISSIGAVNKNSNDNEIQSFRYTITLSNNAEQDIGVESITPVLSEKFLSRVKDKNVTLQVNQTIKKNSSLKLSGEIIFDTKGLEKKDILAFEPFVKEVKIIEERVIKESF